MTKIIILLTFYANSALSIESDFFCWSDPRLPKVQAGLVDNLNCGDDKKATTGQYFKISEMKRGTSKEVVCFYSLMCDKVTEDMKAFVLKETGKKLSEFEFGKRLDDFKEGEQEKRDNTEKLYELLTKNFGGWSNLTCVGKLVKPKAGLLEILCDSPEKCNRSKLIGIGPASRQDFSPSIHKIKVQESVK